MTNNTKLSCAAMLIALFTIGHSTAFSQLVCKPTGVEIVQNGAITGTDSSQVGRINRNGITGSCPVGKTNTLFNSTPVHADTYTYTNPTGGPVCVSVDFDAQACGGNSTQMAAYSTYDPLNPGNNVISDFGFSTTGVATFGFPLAAGSSYTLVVHEIVADTGCPSYNFRVSYRASCRQPGYDRAYDGRSDPAVFRPSNGNWYVLNSSGGFNNLFFGQSGDVPTAGDYTGDGQTDVSVYRPTNNTWYYATSQTVPQSTFTAQAWGTAGDLPAPGDYDGDGRSDIAVFRPSNGTWYVLNSMGGTFQAIQWGQNGDIPAAGDFDGDLKTDFVVVRPNQAGIAPNYLWYLRQSNFASGFNLAAVWGTAGDKIVPGDYDGNGKTDIGVFRPSDGRWYVQRSITQNAISNVTTVYPWGSPGDIPQPADYDGDSITDYAVYRPASGTWYLLNSNGGLYNSYGAPVWGLPTDIPVSAPYTIRP